MKMDVVALHAGALDGVSQMHRHLPHHHVVNEVATRRSKRAFYQVDSQALGQILERPWSICEEAGANSRPKSRVRVSQLFPPGTRLTCWLTMEFQFLLTSYQLNICPCSM